MNPPIATYRLQFRDGMTFGRAEGLVPYFKRLGVSHLYASPIFRATSGSTHGYDVVDHNEIDPALGGREGLNRLSEALSRHDMGLILDIVPNHMAASLENPWWRSVIQWGADSPFAGHFDIDWREKLTLPVLGRSFDEALGAGELTLTLDAAAQTLALAYFDQRFPLHPRSWSAVLPDIPPEPEAAQAYLRHAIGRGRAQELGHGLSAQQDPDRLRTIHEAQPWRLMFWQEARRRLSYRRFFEVTGLVGVRVEEEPVFQDVHRLVLELVRSGQVDGLRIDHVDGLADPAGYLHRLRQHAGPETYIVVEKILEQGERLPTDWPVSGTTGYEFIAAVSDALVDHGRWEAMDRAYAAALGSPPDLQEERRSAKRQMVYENFETELDGLVRLAGGSPDAGFSDLELRTAIAETAIAFPVYRTYGTGDGELSADDRDVLRRAGVEARRHVEGNGRKALEYVLRLLQGDLPGTATQSNAEFRIRFQQLTGPVMAKAVEDTLFYRYHRLIALNEVGGDPARTGTVAEFHRQMQQRAREQPFSLSASTTHDTKRGEDARARLYSISEAPEAWAEAVARWRGRHRDLVRPVGGKAAPEPETEWMLYQALAGIWDGKALADAGLLSRLRERFLPYVEKALREAKRRTDWVAVDTEYEGAVAAYAERLLAPENRPFLEDFHQVLLPYDRAGRFNGWTQTLLRLTAPGIPDIYQGTETEDFSLVDPDNRRIPDFERLAAWLDDERLPDADCAEPGRIKQRLICAGLRLRQERFSLFADGDYLPLQPEGPLSAHALAYMRRLGNDCALVIVPRLTLSLPGTAEGWLDPAAWAETILRLPREFSAMRWKDAMTGQGFQGDALELQSVLARFPFALLVNERGPAA